MEELLAHLFLLRSLKLTDGSKKNKIIHSFLSGEEDRRGNYGPGSEENGH